MRRRRPSFGDLLPRRVQAHAAVHHQPADRDLSGATTHGAGRFQCIAAGQRRCEANHAVGLTVQVNNALDVQAATDVNLLPLPGRLVFVGLEVRS